MGICQLGQIAVSRVESMPNEPTPFNIRDWKNVALQYDEFVFDRNKVGQHLPFIYFLPSGVNYPERRSFGLHTYVGTFSPLGNEAINVLPTIVGSTLVGIDKRNQSGEDYVLMSQDFFNKRNGEGIYLNNAGGRSGIDWWYDLMPNVFFYQLYDLYPNLGDEADFQFRSVANRFLQSVRALGGSGTPWKEAFMDYRAFNFIDMTPLAQGVRQPEAAGAYAWVLYNAYQHTGDRNYLAGAEWSMEFLSKWNQNPSYELQLPYGIYTAARMNAEIRTQYDIEKMINWKFNRGFLRGWGTIVGRWGGLEVSGLVGEANDNGNDYAFQLNGIQHAAALVPMVRYDKRFARAIGKWVLNLANATRLFYPGFLPAHLQDASAWSNVYDPNRVIGYEALRERWNGQSPFSTGDALVGGWAATNLALYGSSSIGYLGAMVDRTDDPRILKIDLLKTDFFGKEAYPTYLYFNPYTTSRTISTDVGEDPIDLYDALTETFIAEAVSGMTSITIPANQARMLVSVPAGAIITYDLNKKLANGVVIDYQQQSQPYLIPPRIKGLMADRDTLQVGDSVSVFLTISKGGSEQVESLWQSSGGQLRQIEPDIYMWKAPEMPGTYTIFSKIVDESGDQDSLLIPIVVVAEINVPPVIEGISVSSGFVKPGETVSISCIASDPNGDELVYEWNANVGIINGNGPVVQWTAPMTSSVATVTCMVSDGRGGSATASRQILAKDLSGSSEADAIAIYPFEGTALDISGNELHGNVAGAVLTQDRQGRQGRAYRFNGSTAHISVNAQPVLDVREGISVVVMFQASVLPDRESFLVSHGSWQNRWKLSITPDRKLRWTVNTVSGITDLDSDILMESQQYYHAVVAYDGQFMTLYLNGELINATARTGLMRGSTLPLLIGQMLPGDTGFNFNGTIDEVRIYNKALLPADVSEIYNQIITSTKQQETDGAILIGPNPVQDKLVITTSILGTPLDWQIVDVNGRVWKSGKLSPGYDDHTIPLAELTSGSYLLKIGYGQRDIQVKKFIKY